MSSIKRIRMERLSPIPLEPSVQNSDPCTPGTWRTTPMSSMKLGNELYSIEPTSSPEIGQSPFDGSSCFSHKRKKSKHPLPRNRSKNVSRKLVSTPLTGLISRKVVSKGTPNEADKMNDAGLKYSQELPVAWQHGALDDLKADLPPIDSFSSPEKPILDLSRHAQIKAPDEAFASKTVANAANSYSLLGLVKKSASQAHYSTDSFNVLPDVDGEDERGSGKNLEDDCCVALPQPIEYFESPAKAAFENHLSRVASLEGEEMSFGFDVNSESSELRLKPGNRKRKRALDFEHKRDYPASAVQLSPPRSPVLLVQNHAEIPRCSGPISSYNCTDFGSEADTIIDATPNLIGSLHSPVDVLSGFTISSSFIFSPTQPIEDSEERCADYVALNIDSVEELPSSGAAVSDLLPPEVISQGSPSKGIPELNAIDALEESQVPLVIECPEKTLCNLKFTKTNIVACESPSKPTNIFSEAIRIDAFCSPERDTCDLDRVLCCNEGPEDSELRAIPAGEEELVEESEEITSRKRRKKGFFTELAEAVISRTNASSSLFDYEMKTGLRPSAGKYVSCPLVVCKLWAGQNSSFVSICRPLKYFEQPVSEPRDERRSSLVAIIVQKLHHGLTEGSVVQLHYPLTIIFSSQLQLPYVLAGNQMVPHPFKTTISDYDVDRLLNTSTTELPSPKLFTSVKYFPSNTASDLSEAALCQNLLYSLVLSLKVLHVVRNPVEGGITEMTILCTDETSFCWMHFTSELDVKRVLALETLHVAADGSKIQIEGFKVVKTSFLDKKTRNLLIYCVNSPVNCREIFTLVPAERSWVITSLGGKRGVKKGPTPIEKIVADSEPGKRYLVEVHAVEFIDRVVNLMDERDVKLPFVQGEKASKVLFETLSTPFSLDAVYYFEGKLFSDAYTRVISSKA